MQIDFTARQILVDGRPNLLLGGEFQYFRIPPALWRSSLEKLRTAGLNVISAYIPWIWHEVAEGEFDFTGRTDPGRDLVGFLALCEELGLPLVAKPGPYIFAEYQGFGVPTWLVRDHPDLLMKVGKPQAFPQPSLNHPRYLAYVRVWFERVAEVMRTHVTRGHIVAIQIDNETGYPQFGQGPHMTDRNPETLALLRLALREQFRDVDELNRLWGTHFADFDHVEPHDEKLYNQAMLDTMARYVEDYIVHYLAALKRIWDDIDLPTFYFLNDIFLDSWPSHLGKKNQVAVLAYDIYARYSDLPITFDQPYSISFVPKLFAAFLEHGPLICAEMGCGWLDPACEVTPASTWLSTMAAFAHGTKACFYYPVMDGRDPHGDYIFKPLLDISGEQLPRIEVARRVADFCREWGPQLAESVAVTSPIAILHYPAITREMMSAALDPVGMVLKGSQRAIDEALTIVSVNAGLFGALAEAGYSPVVTNLERATIDDLCVHEVIFFNSIGVLDPRSQLKLLEYVRRGGRLVTLGTPFSEDSRLFPAKTIGVLNPQAGPVLFRVAWDYLKLYWRIARKFTHSLCAYTVEGMYPAMLMTRFATRTGLWLETPEQPFVRPVNRLWASRLVTLSRPSGDVKPLLTHRGRIAGYEAALERGRSVFLGTLLGASFDSPGYYLDDPERLHSVSEFLANLLGEWKIAPLVSAIDRVESVVREGPHYRLVFLLNRGPARTFAWCSGLSWEGYELKNTFAGETHQAEWRDHQLVVTMAADDILCARWECSLSSSTAEEDSIDP